MENIVLPLKGYGKLTFGMTPEQVTSLLGAPDYYEEDNDDEEMPILYYEYENLALGVYFEIDGDKKTLSYFETGNEEITLYGKKVFSLSPNQLIKLMKENGMELSETETDGGETRFSFDKAMLDFFYEGDTMTAASWSDDEM